VVEMFEFQKEFNSQLNSPRYLQPICSNRRTIICVSVGTKLNCDVSEYCL